MYANMCVQLMLTLDAAKAQAAKKRDEPEKSNSPPSPTRTPISKRRKHTGSILSC